MTRYVVDIEEVVLRGVAADEARDLGARVEQRLSALVSAPDDVRRTGRPDQPDDLADRVARSIWVEVHRAQAGGPAAPTALVTPRSPAAGAGR